jgi:hypothetical protein
LGRAIDTSIGTATITAIRFADLETELKDPEKQHETDLASRSTIDATATI